MSTLQAKYRTYTGCLYDKAHRKSKWICLGFAQYVGLSYFLCWYQAKASLCETNTLPYNELCSHHV